PGPDRVPAFAGASHALGAEAAFGTCAYCHSDTALELSPHSSELRCETCHQDSGSGHFGPGHETLPGPELVPAFALADPSLGPQARFGSCAYCHNDLGANLDNSGALDLVCTTCHVTALSDQFGPRHRSVPGPELVPSFVGPSHRLADEARFG